MKTHSLTLQLCRLSVATAFLLSGCASTLVKDDVRQKAAAESHCAGSEWADNSSLAVLPIPVVAFFVPHADLHEIKADDYLRRCGESTRLINRRVEVNRGACIPAGLTRIVTLGIYQWCPAQISWEADLKP